MDNRAVLREFGVGRNCEGDRLDVGASSVERWFVHHSRSSRDSRGEAVVWGMGNREAGGSVKFSLLVAVDVST